MFRFIDKLARWSAYIGGVVLTVLVLLMTASIIGGAIAKLGYSDWLQQYVPSLAGVIQACGIRTIPGIFEIAQITIAFVIFSFFPITSLTSAHAVVDIFTNFLPQRLNRFLMAFWEVIFFLVFVLITWRLYLGAERMYSSHRVLQELQLPEWYGYAIAVLQMAIASLVAGFSASRQIAWFIGSPKSAETGEGEEQ